MLIKRIKSRVFQRGLGLVELMVGITIGMIVAAGASMLAVNQINEHRRLMLDTQVQQDLRAAADILQQDVRRIGFRGLAKLGVWEPASGVGTAFEEPAKAASSNIYTNITKTDAQDFRSLEYQYARPDSDGDYNTSATAANNEYFGIKWDKGTRALYLKLGKKNGTPNWAPITDPDAIEIIDFDINVISQDIPLDSFCDKQCVGPACPKQQIRRIDFLIRGKARHVKDGSLIRTLTGSERVRADAVTGSCPA